MSYVCQCALLLLLLLLLLMLACCTCNSDTGAVNSMLACVAAPVCSSCYLDVVRVFGFTVSEDGKRDIAKSMRYIPVVLMPMSYRRVLSYRVSCPIYSSHLSP